MVNIIEFTATKNELIVLIERDGFTKTQSVPLSEVEGEISILINALLNKVSE